MKNTIKMVAAASALASLPASAAIALVSGPTGNATSGTQVVNFDASSFDKLVVIVTGEHGFNNDQGAVTTLDYDGAALTAASYRTAQVASTDTLYNGIFYLDAPSTSTGNITLVAATRGVISVFGLTGTEAGVGANGISATGTQTINLTTTGSDSIVFTSFGLGGAGNTGAVGSVDTVGSLVERTAVSQGSNWNSHVTGSQIVSTAGATDFTYTGGNTAGAFVVAAEFTAAPIPEPSTIGLAALAGLGLLRRRR